MYQQKRRPKTILVLLLLLLFVTLGFSLFLGVFYSIEVDLYDVPGISKYALANEGRYYNIIKISRYRFSKIYFFYVKPIHYDKFKKTEYKISGSGQKFSNLIHEFEYIETRPSTYKNVSDTAWNSAKELFHNSYEILSHPIDTLKGLWNVPKYLYRKTANFIDDPSVVKKWYTNELKRKAERHNIDFNNINLDETRVHLKRELDTELSTKSTIEIVSLIIPGGVAFKTIRALKVSKTLGKATGLVKLENRATKLGHTRKRGNAVKDLQGKSQFYPKAKESLKSKGYKYYDGDKQIKGKTRQHKRKPDYVAEKNGDVIIGETKSPNEPPTSPPWRQKQSNDSDLFANVRENVAAREKSGMLDREVGGHEIIIQGQIPDYVSNMGRTYDIPTGTAGKSIKGGYTVPSDQAKNVEAALKNCGKKTYEKIDNGNGSITYIFDL